MRDPPTQQRLRGHDRARGEVDARLIAKRELVSFESAAQQRLHLEALGHQRIQLAGKELEVVAPAFLCAIHRRVGVFEESLRIAAVVRVESHADAAGDVELSLLNDPWLRDGGEHTLHDLCYRFGPRMAVDEQDELVSAQPCHRVALAHARLQSSGDLLQQLVAELVAEAVVDEFEPVQIDERHREAGTVRHGCQQGLLQPVLQQ